MRTKRILTLGICGCLVMTISAQQWLTGGNPVVGGDYLGANGASVAPLHLQTIPQLSIDFSTQNSLRARLYPNDFTFINGYTGTLHQQNGFFALSGRPGFFNMGVGPFSRLHLVDDVGANGLGTYAQQLGWRPWMRNGVTFTGNEDQGYIGQKYVYGEPFVPIGDRSDMVLQWSNDYAGEDGPDRLRFMFTNEPGEVNGGPVASGARSTEGLEGMRLTPIDENNINVGVGDFFAGNLVDATNINEPTERLDVLTGRVRIRQLPTDPEATTENRYMVVDPTGVVRWRNLPPSAVANCEWGRHTTNRYVLSGTAPANSGGLCPDRAWLYGIGSFPGYKLHVDHSDADMAGASGGIYSHYSVNSTNNASMYGIRSIVDPAQSVVPNGVGVHATVNSPGLSGVGVFGQVLANNPATTATVVTGSAGKVSASQGTIATVAGASGEVILGASASVATSYGIKGASNIGNSAAPGATAPKSYGSHGSARLLGGALSESFGSYGYSKADAGSSVGSNYGVYGYSEGSSGVTNGYGVYAKAVNATNNYGVYATAYGTGTNFWAGWFAGNTWTQNTGYFTNGTATISDAQLKTNVEELTGAMDKVMSLAPKTYVFLSGSYPTMRLPIEAQIGLIAQEVEEVVPEAVHNTVVPA